MSVVVVLTAILPDKRILLHRKLITGQSKVQWSVTREYKLPKDTDVIRFVQNVAWADFGVDVIRDQDTYVDVKLIPTTKCNEAIIRPVVMTFKSMAAWEAKTDDQYKAQTWSELSQDILTKSIYPKREAIPLHTNISIHALQHLHERRLISD